MSAGKPGGWVLAGCLGLMGCVAEPVAPGGPDAPSVPSVTAPPPADSTPLPPTPLPPEPLPPAPFPPAPPPRPESCSAMKERRLQWLNSFPGRVAALTTNAREEVAFFTETPEGDAAGLLDPEGQSLWSRPGLSPLVSFSGMSVAPSTGRFYAWGYSASSWHAFWGAAAYSFDASGQQPKLIGQGCDECSLGPYHEDANGNLLERHLSSSGSGIVYTSRAGESWHLYSWKNHDDNEPGIFHYAAAAFDAQGQIVILATLQDTTVFQGRTFGQSGQFTFVVLKLSAHQELLWVRELPATWGSRGDIGVADSGQVVVRGRFGGSLDWPGAPLEATSIFGNDFLLALDARGEPLWRQFAPTDSHLSVAPSGASVLVSRVTAPSPGLLVDEFSPEGCLRWSQSLTTQEAEGRVTLASVAWSGEALLLGGGFNGTVDFGSGPQQAPLDLYTPKGFLLKLRHP